MTYLRPLLWALQAAIALSALVGTVSGEPEWQEAKPVRQVSDARLGRLLSDIESRMPAGHIYRDEDLVTWAHETTHGVNSRIRNERKAKEALYCLGGRVAVFMHAPQIRRQDLAAYIPSEFRSSTAFHYVTKSVPWYGPGMQIVGYDTNPLYLLDEWVAYTNGSAVGLELDAAGLWRGGDRCISVENMLMFNAYATALLTAIERHEPNYPDREKLTNFIGWHISRTLEVAEQAKSSRAFYRPQQDQIVQSLRRFWMEGQQ